MLTAIRDRGFDLIRFDDPIVFRYAYESQYRSQWDKGLNTDLVVVLHSAEPQLNKLPYDLLKRPDCEPLTFALHQFFPKLNYKVIAGLDRAYLDAVDEAYQQHDGSQLTERETKEFVLMHCFGIVPKLIKTPVQLLKELLSLHSCKVRLPDFLAEYLLESLTKEAAFAKWPLADILTSREKFLRFLQSEWKLFLASLSDKSQQYRVPFSHEDVRAYIDTFFLDGSLTPLEREDVTNLPAWVMTGVAHDPKVDAVLATGLIEPCGRCSSKRFPPPMCRTGNGSKRPSDGQNWSSCVGSGTRPWTPPTAPPGLRYKQRSKTPSASG